MCPGLGDLTASSSPHNVGRDPRSLSFEEVPPARPPIGGGWVFRLGVLSVYVFRACDLDRWAAVPPRDSPHPVKSGDGWGRSFPFMLPPAWNRLGTGRKEGQTELSAPLQPQPGGEGERSAARSPAPVVLRGGSVGGRSQALQMCQPTVGGPVCLPPWAGSACQPHLGTPHPHTHPERRARRVLLS